MVGAASVSVNFTSPLTDPTGDIDNSSKCRAAHDSVEGAIAALNVLNAASPQTTSSLIPKLEGKPTQVKASIDDASKTSTK
jgi:hypothetical protein